MALFAYIARDSAGKRISGRLEAMNEQSIPVTYVVFPDEGHGFAKPENNMAFNAVLENFLAFEELIMVHNHQLVRKFLHRDTTMSLLVAKQNKSDVVSISDRCIVYS